VRLDAYRDCLLELLPARHAAHVWIGDVAHGARVVRDDHSVVLGESGQEPGRMGDMGLTWPHGVDALLIIISCVDKLIQFRVHLRSEFGIDRVARFKGLHAHPPCSGWGRWEVSYLARSRRVDIRRVLHRKYCFINPSFARKTQGNKSVPSKVVIEVERPICYINESIENRIDKERRCEHESQGSPLDESLGQIVPYLLMNIVLQIHP